MENNLIQQCVGENIKKFRVAKGLTLDEVQTQREIGKAPYQKVLMVIGSGVFAFVLCIIVGIVISFFK